MMYINYIHPILHSDCTHDYGTADKQDVEAYTEPTGQYNTLDTLLRWTVVSEWVDLWPAFAVVLLYRRLILLLLSFCSTDV